MDANRYAAYKTLLAVEKEEAYSNIELNKQIGAAQAKASGFIRELVYGVLENKLLIDFAIDSYVRKGIKSLKKQELTILRMGMYQLLYMNSVPDHAAVNESVMLAKRVAKGRSGLINGVLRSFIRAGKKIKLPEGDDKVKHLSVKYSYEPWIVRLWIKKYGEAFAEELLSCGNKRPGLVLRTNTLKTDREKLIEALRREGFEAEKSTLAPQAVKAKGEGILETELFKNGYFSVQDEASQIAVEMLDPKPGELVADVCAAPGGKSCAIAERMQGKGKITARDIYENKIALIDKEAQRLGIKIIEASVHDAGKFDESLEGKADRVLVDAPCSGLGVVRRKPEIKYKKDKQEREFLPKVQFKILMASSGYVKSGGVLVYSTCTVNPAENDEIADRFLDERSDFEEIYRRQLFPNTDGTDGFFICRMKKK